MRIHGQAEYGRELRVKLFSCPFCSFIEETIGLSNLENSEDSLYLVHIKRAHGLIP
jgi:hypothetical protein